MVSRPVLVTGAAGFVGSHLVDVLLETGCGVIGLDRRAPAEDPMAAANLGAALDNQRFSFVTADLACDDLAATVERCETVFHLAAVPGVRSSWGPRFGEYVSANLLGTANLLEACDDAGIQRLIFASSSSVYGAATGPSRETDPASPISPYGVTKLAAEQLCLAYAHRPRTRLNVCALRYFTVYGPRQRADMAITRVLIAALDGVPLTLYGDGKQRREFTYVSDVVAATAAAARIDAPSPIINVGGGTSVTMLEVLRLAEELTGRPLPVRAADDRPGDVPATEADLRLARSSLGYRPLVGLAEGMSRQLEWLSALGSDGRRAYLARSGGR